MCPDHRTTVWVPQLFVTSIPVANNCKILGSRCPWLGISLIALLLRWPLAGPGGASGTREGYSHVLGDRLGLPMGLSSHDSFLCVHGEAWSCTSSRGPHVAWTGPSPWGSSLFQVFPDPLVWRTPRQLCTLGTSSVSSTSTPLFHSAARAGCAPAADTWTSLRAAALDPALSCITPTLRAWPATRGSVCSVNASCLRSGREAHKRQELRRGCGLRRRCRSFLLIPREQGGV